VREDHQASQPQTATLQQNFPNPFNSSTVIHFALPSDQNVNLTIHNLAWQQVVTLVEGASSRKPQRRGGYHHSR
jgi:hypothetical protein